MPLVLLERFQGTRFNGIYFIRFGFRLGNILNFKWLLSLKIQLNHKKLNFGRKNQLKMWSHLKDLPFSSSTKHWHVPLVSLERCQWTWFNGIYFVSFGFRMGKISNLKLFSSLQIQINYKKPSSGRKNQLRMRSHLQGRSYLTLQKLDIEFGV